jgi:ribosomal protein S5
VRMRLRSGAVPHLNLSTAPPQYSAGHINLSKHLTEYKGKAMKKGPMKPGHRGPRPAAFMEYGASTVIRQTVARKAPGGNIRKFKVTSILGNGKGYAGIGVAQSADNGRLARSKSLTDAVKNMFYVERYQGRTIYHAMQVRAAEPW